MSQVIQRIIKRTKKIIFSSAINILLAFVFIGLICGKLQLDPILVFATNFLAIIPLASVLAFSTDEIADKAGSTIGGLLNASFGNAVEVIISVIALKHNQIRIIQTSMIGSILSNLLLVLGCCFVAGGYNRLQQTFNKNISQPINSLMCLAACSLIIPAAFNATVDHGKSSPEHPSYTVLGISRFSSIVLLIIYVLFLFFQFYTHRSLFDETLQNNLPDSEEGSIVLSDDAFVREKEEVSAIEPVIVLALATILISFCADYLVDSIDSLVEKTGLSKSFIGLVLIPIVGNAAEHVTAMYVAMQDKMDLAIGVALGSSMQIAIFVTPLTVLIGWMMNIEMSLQFSIMEVVALFLGVFLTNSLVMDNESNWLEGAMLLGTYIMIALAFYYVPDDSL